METLPLLEIQDLTKDYGKDRVLDRLSLTVLKNEVLTILGPSGSGKSTLLKILAGLEEPSEGQIQLNGDRIESVEPEARHIGMVFQEGLLFPQKTVRQNVAFPLEMRGGLSKGEIEREVSRVLHLVQLSGEKYRSRYPNQLSGGEAQRVALARGLVGRPQVLLLDEPLANVDRQLRKSLEIEIRDYHQQTGVPFVYVTHNQEEALAVGDRMAVLNGGRIEQIDSPQSIYQNPQSSFVAAFIGSSNSIFGELEQTDRQTARVRVGDHVLPAVKVNGEHLPKGSRCGIWVKKENTLVTTDHEEPQQGFTSLEATVKDVLFKGPTTEVVLEVAGIGRLTSVTTSASMELRSGASVQVRWETRHALLFPEAD